jgi:hypothetical protein
MMLQLVPVLQELKKIFHFAICAILGKASMAKLSQGMCFEEVSEFRINVVVL